MAADGAVVSLEELLERVWDENVDPFTNTVRMTIMKLRRKLGEPARRPDGARRRLPRLSRLPIRLAADADLRRAAGRRDGAACSARAGCCSTRHLDRTLPAPLRGPTSLGAARRAVRARARRARRCWRSASAGWRPGRALRAAPHDRRDRRGGSPTTGSTSACGSATAPTTSCASSPTPFDAMLDRVEGAVAAQRRFVANATHELRTPLTVIRTEAEVALDDPDASVEELRAVAREVVETTERTEELLDGLLVLAAARRGAPRARRPRRPRRGRAARAAAAARGEAAAARGRRPRGARPGARSAATAALLERLAGNLVENAVRHGRAGGAVRDQRARATAAGRALRVANGGRVVAAGGRARLGRAVRAARRAARARAPASACRSCARSPRRTAGALRLARRAPGGLAAEVVLPGSGGRRRRLWGGDAALRSFGAMDSHSPVTPTPSSRHRARRRARRRRPRRAAPCRRRCGSASASSSARTRCSSACSSRCWPAVTCCSRACPASPRR